ncbi:hypothetical protein BX666DRAFT_71140 [Dichotomocladium elegans]|nr:hypothetical protein BX666DRAFT_71140 [Dichotomocladium elegans]
MPVEQERVRDSDRPINTPPESSPISRATTSVNRSQQPEPPKKLTPMEKLKLKMRAGLEKQIKSEEREKRWRERELELERIRARATILFTFIFVGGITVTISREEKI